MKILEENGFTGCLEETACPTCDNPQPPNLFFLKKNNIGIWQCPNCEILYASPRFTEKSLSEIYESKQFLNRQTLEELENWSYSQWKTSRCRSYITTSLVVSLVQEYVRNGSRLLDVGSAMGYFVYESRKQGYATEGIEPSNMLVNIANRKLNITLHNCRINDFSDTERFSGIVLWDVLEHVYDPSEMLQHCARLAKPGAYLFVQVPNYCGISDRFKTFLHRIHLKNNNFKHFGFPWHVYSFNRKSLGIMLAKSGFQPLKFESWSHWVKEGKQFILPQIQMMLTKYCLSDYIICVARYSDVVK